MDHYCPKLAIDALDSGYPLSQVCKKYGIPRSGLRDHYIGKRESRKSGPQGVLIPAEEEKLVHYLQEMVKVFCPLNITQLRAKVTKLTQTSWIPLTNGIPEKSWIKWFKNRHPDLVLRVPEGLDLNRAKALCPQNVERFYENLKDLYEQHQYQPS